MPAAGRRPWPTPREAGEEWRDSGHGAQAPAWGTEGTPGRSRGPGSDGSLPMLLPPFVFLQSTQFLLIHDTIFLFIFLTVSLTKM